MKRRCSARSSRTGERCRRAAIRGGLVCATHGGRAPQVKEAARRRLDALVEPAIEGLEHAIREGDIHAIVRAATVVLDRAGYGPRSALDLRQDMPDVSIRIVARDDGA